MESTYKAIRNFSGKDKITLYNRLKQEIKVEEVKGLDECSVELQNVSKTLSGLIKAIDSGLVLPIAIQMWEINKVKICENLENQVITAVKI